MAEKKIVATEQASSETPTQAQHKRDYADLPFERWGVVPRGSRTPSKPGGPLWPDEPGYVAQDS